MSDTRPAPVYQRSKHVRSWLKDDIMTIESYLEDAVHFIVVQISVNNNSHEILDVKVNFLRCPYPDLCIHTADRYLKIKGLKIEKGMFRNILQQVPVDAGCTHVISLLREAGDAYMQSKYYHIAGSLTGKERRKKLLEKLRNSCFVYSDLNNQ